MMISLNTTLPPASNATVASAGAVTIPGNLPLFAQQLSQTAAATAPVIEQPYAANAALPSQLRFVTQPGMASWQAGAPADPVSAQEHEQTPDQRDDAIAQGHATAPLEGLLPAMASPVMAPAMPVQNEPLAADEHASAPAAATFPAAGFPTAGASITMTAPPASMSAASTASVVAASSFAAPSATVQAMQQVLPATNTPAYRESGSRPSTLQAFARGADDTAPGSPLTAVDPAASKRGGTGSAAFGMPTESAHAAPAAATVALAAPAASRDGDRTGSNGAVSAATSTAPLLQSLTGAAVAPATGGNDTIKLNGSAQQWQEPLREALGERLQTQIGRNSEHAVIRLDPPMLGRIEISIRHQAGALQVNLSASNSEVLRQLQGIGENMRSDLAQRQYTEVAVNINATPRSPAAQAFAEHDGRGQRQPGRQQDDGEPGRALSDGTPAGATFAMHEREYN